DLKCWIDCHKKAFNFFGGSAKIIVPDNLKSAVSKSCRYEPDINPTYHDMAMHYGTIIIPARAAKPKDKPKVENAVQIVERRILAKLRKHIFFSICELNQAIEPLLKEVNHVSFQKLDQPLSTIH
ncbi:MAG: transposase, partial [Actinobacteria bacterium]|nr:transposase [Actinomycetota bacterium]